LVSIDSPQETHSLTALDSPSADPRVTRSDDGRWMATAPAKLNLGLRVHPVRPDGFHDIESWFVPISWHDTLAFTPDRPLEIVVTGRTEGIPADPAKNLIGRAASALAHAAGIAPRAKIELHKILPPGGGLGGGSSDAALALLALNAAWDLHLPLPALMQLAATLGSDVPFFVQGQPALCTGRGEIVTSLPPRHPLFAVLIVPPQGIGTKGVFETFDATRRSGTFPGIDWCQNAALPARQLSDSIINDLEPAAFTIAPWLEQLRDLSVRLCGQKVHMTGSGSTLFTLCGSSLAASELQKSLTAELPGNTMCVPVRILQPR
jgi:4-diphosphocytidyl-2-C-methyl-D-erythritol kinase